MVHVTRGELARVGFARAIGTTNIAQADLTMSAHRVMLAVPSSQPFRDRLGAVLVSLGYEVTLAESAEEVRDLAGANALHLVITEPGFVATGGDGLFRRWRELLPGVPIVVLPDLATTEAAGASASGAGAAATLPASKVMVALEQVLGTVRSNRGPAAPAQGPRPPLDPFVGQSPSIRRLAEEALKALSSENPILIEGETGSGKGVLAAWLHRHGPRAHEEFVDLNCAGLSRELMDSQLFGHEKGAFTGAVTANAGLLEAADRGTLFLDEVGDMDGPIQAKLLKVIEERRFRRVGATRERHADVRIITATHHNLLQRVRDGLFREDLYYRICVLPMRIPALRFRSGDIPALARRILTHLALESGGPEPVLAPETEQVLVAHAWPGNLRELRNVLVRAMLKCGEGPIQPSHLELEPSADLPGLIGPEGGTLAEMERAYIRRVLDLEDQHVERTAQRLGIARSTFYNKLRSLGMSSRG
jgi:DNA-binding NtrC family response regulator